MPRPSVDYSLYYVTGRSLLPSSANAEYYLSHLEEALQGGVTVVQIREKDVDSREFLEIATKSKEVCDKVSGVVAGSLDRRSPRRLRQSNGSRSASGRECSFSCDVKRPRLRVRRA